ncbi:hypothetical protein BUALT_Bualt19G0112500 [Buddleja alternifolia]|uniref:Sorting nexin-13 n=1 Tax=Buddleja alternifolia TaxID=168488 RepID=A0AAV6WBI8_9LAMI|nr:hypothetical protein BUALT_Bualt19G0112500 [Buddleja alternifolia]
MKNAVEILQDLIEEAMLRTVWWILCIFAVCYFLTHTSKSMLMNLPIAVLLVSGLRILFNEVELRWKVRNARPTSYLSHLEKNQLSVNDSGLTTQPPPQKWKRKIDSPVVEAAIEDFVNKLLHDFVTDLWYSEITPDKEAPELIHAIVMDALGEVSGRIKEVNLVDLLTRDVVDLIGDHIDLFRRTQASIGVDVMVTLSSEERDERLKHQLMAFKRLHPALISPECEYKVIQRLIGGLLAVVLRPREAQCPLVWCIARELLTCLVVQPLMNLVSPVYINELIEYIILAFNSEGLMNFFTDQSPNVEGHKSDHRVSGENGQNNESNMRKNTSSDYHGDDLCPSGNTMHDEPSHPQPDWAKVFDAATQRRTEVLMPENLENMWTVGRNYKRKLQKKAASGLQAPETSHGREDKESVVSQQDTRSIDLHTHALSKSQYLSKKEFPKDGSIILELENNANIVSQENRNKLKRSNSTSDLEVQSEPGHNFTSQSSAPLITEFYTSDVNELNIHSLKSSLDMVLHSEVPHVPKLRCRVVGADFEKLDSNSFAVYVVVVTDADNTTWSVKRRYRNFERLHRHLKDIPNYTLHLPPKRIFSSSTEDTFVHERCIQLDKYLQDLMSIPNVAEQHEVWDFLSASSKNYSFGKSSSVMKTLADIVIISNSPLMKTVIVDDAVDDIVRQFKGVSDGLMRAVVGSQASSYEPSSSVTSRNMSWNADDLNKLPRQTTLDSINSFSDIEEDDKDVEHDQEEVESAAHANGWHSDNEFNSKRLPQSIVKRGKDVSNLDSLEIHSSKVKFESSSLNRYPESSLALISVPEEDPTGVPPEWTPPNLSVPVLNLVDNIFQLKRRGWLRRQVFWMSLQIVQLIMGDAIDDLLLQQIQWLRREDVIAQGIRWIQDILWPNGTFFLSLPILSQLNGSQANEKPQQTTGKHDRKTDTRPGSFERQLEAARRASDVKKFIFDGAPTALVSLIGYKQYRRCARDIYYFLQSEVCLKQVGYEIVELVLISIFPELRDVVRDIHEKNPLQPV